ncbi:acyl-[ACP]--phospholipid O-acyltransferase [Magnetovibrio blakemorei]|uniref:2-acyl-glycerophospho-ethanolamine acyltransferase n=1 Tax=Magnetovibrio blakemorei TaxID=28181 RepID=A0A1E5Q8J7_9PROT|nr:acyl-[ACP]--phospholipid O-acyltransferase [Magnetovibrio blakemorei]OEJ67572.1 2-acyl-glycerophospho-ethanolamine acyltransferase [Magnetovibrio blakemorei]
MSSGSLHLFKTRRFVPLFVTQFLGALNDNLFKSALVMLITYQLADGANVDGPLMVTAAAGVFILPFFLFSATAGQLADRFDKAQLSRYVKAAEVIIMTGAGAAFLSQNIWALMVVLFAMGTQSSLFGPVKYAILPQHLHKDELIAGNAMVEAGTFLAILLGTIAGGLLILTSGGVLLVSLLIVAIALLGYSASILIPTAPAMDPKLRINLNFLAATGNMIRHAASKRDVFLSILGISWFWLVGATFLSQFPTFAKEVLGGDESVVTALLSIFSIGIAIGSALCAKLLKGEVTPKYVPFAALLMTAFMVDLYFASTHMTTMLGATGELAGVETFLSQFSGVRVTMDLLLIAISGGLYIVPLYAILQTRGEGSHRSRDIAANNIINALFMVASALIITALLAGGMSVPGIFLTVAIANAGVALYICKLLPDELVKAALVWLFKLAFRVEVKGLDHWQAVGDRAVIVVNHVSFLDGILLAAFLPEKPMFAINTLMAEKWWVKPFLALVEAFPMDPAKPFSTKALIHEVAKGKKCVIFPEGRITVTGGLMKVYEGPAMIADKADADVLPVRIDGAQFSMFSRLKGTVRRRWFPKITLTILPSRRLTVNEDLKGSRRRLQAGLELYDVMSDLMFESRRTHQTLFDALLDARTIYGSRSPILEDIGRTPLSYGQLVTGSIGLGRKLAALTGKGANVGVLLPNSIGTAVTFYALQAVGRIPAMVNFSAGVGNMTSALQLCQADVLVTSRQFVEAADLQGTIDKLAQQCKVVWLEDVKQNIGIWDKLGAMLFSTFAARAWHRGFVKDPERPAAVLFTSGSEGTPKGVVLSHDNLLANRYQLTARIEFNPTDTVFNALPVFHSFGLISGLLLPVLAGVRTFLYPSPLHYRVVPELVYDTQATIIFGTDTFLGGYARAANAYDFFKIRYVCAGAEKVKDETRRLFVDKFGLRILEGYGATETAPVLSFNTPMHFKLGTVGRLLPGIEHKLEALPGIETGGKLIVRGPNVMKGYLMADNPGVLKPPVDGWYDTGDIVSIDEHGFVTIQGRAKRFAKIGGEMVSLGAVEDLAVRTWPDMGHAAIVQPDDKKGEQVVLVSEYEHATRDDLLKTARAEGIAEIMVPKSVLATSGLPLLGSGKIDYPGVAAWVQNQSE